ncbi:hypothetical protein B7463_g11489, partial [Scytalidium lignicola]
MSIGQNASSVVHSQNNHIRSEVTSQSLDSRIHNNNGINDMETEDDQEPEEPTVFDMEFFPAYSPEHRTFKRTHVFGQAENYRGNEYQRDTGFSEADEGLERARRRAAGRPMISRTLTTLPFPLLDSFPHIYSLPPPDTSSEVISVNTSLTTDTSVSYRLKTLQGVVNRTIGVDEREALNNSLGVIAEAYEEGWDSGSDEDDD